VGHEDHQGLFYRHAAGLGQASRGISQKETALRAKLMRDARRRYQRLQAMLLDMRENIHQLAPTPPAYQAIREDARRKGTDKLTTQQIDREIAATRRQQAKRNSKRVSK
jgi:hypothetical protein